MKEGNNRGGSSWAPIHVSPQDEALTKFRGINLNQVYNWSINQCLTRSWFDRHIELFDDGPCIAQGNLDEPRKATMNQWTKREAEIERHKTHRKSSQQSLIGSNSCGPLASGRTGIQNIVPSLTMAASAFTENLSSNTQNSRLCEGDIESGFIEKLQELNQSHLEQIAA